MPIKIVSQMDMSWRPGSTSRPRAPMMSPTTMALMMSRAPCLLDGGVRPRLCSPRQHCPHLRSERRDRGAGREHVTGLTYFGVMDRSARVDEVCEVIVTAPDPDWLVASAAD